MQESPFYESVMQRGEQRGIKLGARQMRIESTLDILTDRFPSADVNTLKDTLEAIDDLDRLKQLNINAYRASSLHAFEESLNGV